MNDTASSPYGGDAFQHLLSVMESIAQAVERFSSEDNQRTILAALLNAYGLPGKPPASTEPHEPGLSVVPPLNPGAPEGRSTDENGPATPSGPADSAKRRSPRKKSSTGPLDVDFHPDGKQSLRDFVAAKAPANNFEMNTVVVYYLQEVLGETAIETGHVVAGYIDCGWRLPANPDNALSVTASRTKWLNTQDRKAIRLTNQGRNLVAIDLPRKSKKSA
jgi:hypothetical protein